MVERLEVDEGIDHTRLDKTFFSGTDITLCSSSVTCCISIILKMLILIVIHAITASVDILYTTL